MAEEGPGQELKVAALQMHLVAVSLQARKTPVSNSYMSQRKVRRHICSEQCAELLALEPDIPSSSCV